MGGASLPPGFRFHPTDEELVGYYLKRKSEGKEIELEVIPVIDLYKFDPWELPEKSFLPRRDMEWFFFCPRDRKYPNGSRTNRATKAGFWKATGKDRKIICKSSMTGYRKTLVFYRGRAPLGDRTDWVMYEYRLCDDLSQGFQGAFALCKVIKKNENGLKTSDVCGEPKRKQIGSSSSSMEVIISDDTPIQRSYVCNESNFSSPIATPYCPLMEECEPVSMEINPSSLSISPPLILDSSKEHPQGHGVYGHFPQDEFPKSRTPWQPHDHELSSSSSYSNFAEEIELSDDDLSRFGCVSPYSGHMNYMGFCGNEGIPYEGFETWDQTPIYRQSSGDGSFGELDGLWSQEDNLVIVI